VEFLELSQSHPLKKTLNPGVVGDFLENPNGFFSMTDVIEKWCLGIFSPAKKSMDILFHVSCIINTSLALYFPMM